MSDDKSDKAGGWFGNPLPIVMVVLMAAGVLVKNVPLESGRPIDPERVKFVATSQQDVRGAAVAGPLCSVEQHEKNSNQAVTPTENILMKLLAPHVPTTQHEPKEGRAQCSNLDVMPTEKMLPSPHTPEALCKIIKKLHDEKHSRDSRRRERLRRLVQ